MSNGFDIPSNTHLGNSHDYWKAPQKNSKQIVIQPMEWVKIERDESGFATEECLDKMFSHLPVVLHYNKMGGGYDVLNPQTESLKKYFRVGVKTSKTYTHYLSIPKLEE
ncbi:MAG: hypothetical protein IKV17_07710 [Bacteroidaceae bacterium]|nr:hypothetical protein [Bacteroidaceae bacterium]